MEKVCKIRPFLPVYLDFLILARGGYIQFKPFVVTMRFNTHKKKEISIPKKLYMKGNINNCSTSKTGPEKNYK
jgi:hypothetical protein